MNMRIISFCLMFATSLGLAQEAPKPPGAERAAILEALRHGKQITVRNERYQWLPDVAAVERKSRQTTPQEAIAPFGTGAEAVIETKGRLVLFRSPPKKGVFLEQIGAVTVYPTVRNTRTGALGVLTGTLVVKPKSMGEAAGIASRYGLESVKEYPHLGTVFYRVKADVDIADATAALQADPRIESAYPEIIEHLRTPK